MTIKHDNEKAAGEYLAEIVCLAEAITVCPPDYHSDLIRAFRAGCAYRDKKWARLWSNYRQATKSEKMFLYRDTLDWMAKEILENKE